ncbi:NAD(P)/FAD-dependent oxidoreductase [Pseudocolwellia agarivorans]|uniref:NAD(P)/FAD-dependent oxidoreductase n=1 Tax=Pseudocolwellia agarivorans TaxID=1911682 RepID=UPI0009879217|nr:FAD-dependent oxidoreductase [Pseudocolwellia agarivorans]
MYRNQNTSVFEKPSLVIIGNGMATGRLLDEILERTPGQYQITVIGKEPYGSYNRIMLSSVLAGETTIDGIIQKTPQWYKDNQIEFISGTNVSHIDSENKKLILQNSQNHESLEDQKIISYDELVLAVGSRSAKIPAKNQNVKGLFNFRDIKDTEQIQSFANQASALKGEDKKALVIGGGLLGLEAAYGLAISGVKVTLIHRNKWLLNRQLDQVSGTMLQNIMAAKNINFILGHEVAQFTSNTNKEGENILSGAELTNGETITAEMAVIATGITPNKELAVSANIITERAIVVNDFMQTSNRYISALGECCQHKNSTFGLVDPIWSQCKSLAERLCLGRLSAFKNAPVPTKLKVSGVQLFSAGVVESSDTTQTFVITDQKSSIYRKIIIKNDIIVGVVLFGDVSSGMVYFEMMQNKQKVLHAMPELLIGHEFMAIEAENKDQRSEAA